jgi:hypothetical protein
MGVELRGNIGELGSSGCHVKRVGTGERVDEGILFSIEDVV